MNPPVPGAPPSCPVHGAHPHTDPDVGDQCTTCPQCMTDADSRRTP